MAMNVHSEKDRMVDFITRTQYNYHKFKIMGNYEVTLLINSSIGLLIYAKEKYYDYIEDYLLDDEFLDELLNCYLPEFDNENKSLKDFCRHIRNAIAHSNFDFVEEKSNYKDNYNTIKSVVFEDFNDDGEKTAEIIISIGLLEKFFFEFSNKMIEIINEYGD